MEIYQPFMFVGLGGTGLKVGVELERWLRRNLRGADGETPIGEETRKYLAYELPACFQFVYADLDEDAVHELRGLAAPPGDHKRAVDKTARVATNLVPVQRSYPEVAQSLRVTARDQVRAWLPPSDGEPNIAPLSRGAGQLPTIARACLFETMAKSGGVEVAQRPIREAMHALGGSGDELTALGGARVNACDVFVAFSVAGGTGTGIFYDYMHLIADVFRGSSIEIMIHPLVVMPSAFPLNQGGGRAALLNAGRGLLDLARLVDDQNTRAADKAFGAASDRLNRGLSVAYPGPEQRVIRMDATTIQTAYLFGETIGVRGDDLNRSIVSFILALAGVRNRSGGGTEGLGAGQSFFINRGVARESLAPSGVGSRSMSEAAVTSLSVPRGEVLDILAAHLLSLAVGAADDRGGQAENNEALVRYFMDQTDLGDLVRRPHHAAAGAHEAADGQQRADAMRGEVQELSAMLRRQVPRMAKDFDPWKGLIALLTLPPADGQDPVDLLPPGLLPQAAGDVKMLVSYPIRSAGRGADAPVALVAASVGSGRWPGERAVSLADGGSSAGGTGNGSSHRRAGGPGEASYVPPTRSTEIEKQLTETLVNQLGRQQGTVDPEFSPTKEESLTVVLIRTALGVTDVPEVREVMTHWSTALASPEPEDYSMWRQRLGYHYEWLLTTAEQRVTILQRLLIAMRNGQATITGEADKPSVVEFRVGADADADAGRLRLRLTGFGPTASSWGSLLRAYEESTLGGDEPSRQAVYRALMNVAPIVTFAPGADTSARAPVYDAFLQVAVEQSELLRGYCERLRQRERGAAPSLRLRKLEGLLDFWERAVPEARRKRFAVPLDEGANLEELDEGWDWLIAEDPREKEEDVTE